MDSGVRVDLFEIQCNTDVPDANGCIWSVETISGWDAPDQRTQFVDSTGRHGSSGREFFAKGRALTIPGLVDAPTTAAAWDVFNRLSSAMPGLTGSGDLVVYEPVPKMLTGMRQLGPPRVAPPLNRNVSFNLSVIAEYPWKRALSPVTVAPGAFTAAGTFPAEVEVTTTSAGTVHVEQGGLAIKAGTVPAGTVFTSGPGFTNPPRSVVGPSGEDLYSLTLPGTQWPAVLPGSNEFLNLGTAGVQITYYPTYA